MSQSTKPESLGMAGVASTLVGTFVAVFLIPADPSAQGALVLSSMALSVGILFVPMIRVLNG